MIRGKESLLHIPLYTPFKSAVQLKRELGLRDLIRLGANENALGPSPLALQAMAAATGELHRYPDAGSLELTRRIAAFTGFSADHVVVEAGISGLLRLAVEAFVQPGERVAFPWPTFAVYPMLVHLVGGLPVPVPCTDSLQTDFDAIAAAAQGARMVWLCNPNNPTGLSFPLDEVRRLLDRIPSDCLVVVDEAYYEYGPVETALPLVREGRPVVVMRTFSKVYGLAGLRVGYAVARPDIAEWFVRCRDGFQVSVPAQAAALAALDDTEHVRRSIELVREGRAYLTEACRNLGIAALPSDANFVLLPLGRDCRPLSAALLRQGIMVRATDDIFGLPGHLRATVGTPEMNRRLVQALEQMNLGMS